MDDDKTNKLLSLIMEAEGSDDLLEMLELYSTESVVPGICIDCQSVEANCEPDATANVCSECDEPKVSSVLVLAGLI